MKILIFSLLLIAVGCDTPTRSRFPTATGNGLAAPTDGGLTPLDPSKSGTTTGTTTGGTTQTGFENCNLTTRSTTADLGSVGVCKSSQDETLVRFVTSMANTTTRTCLIPTYKDQSGNTTYLGDPQCTFTDAEKVYTGRLYKNRQGTSSYPVTGVMIMKETLLVDYFKCMDAYISYINYYCPAAPTYPPCVTGASQSRDSLCNYFKQKYPNSYLDLYLR
ncbi:MAG: hypothetical protein ACJ76H_09565 [Bacteriovoracaceae bacterium]